MTITSLEDGHLAEGSAVLRDNMDIVVCFQHFRSRVLGFVILQALYMHQKAKGKGKIYKKHYMASFNMSSTYVIVC